MSKQQLDKNGNPIPELDQNLQDLQKLFANMSFSERFRKTMEGLNKPKDSGEYKFAKLQLQLMSGPIIAILLPLIFVIFLFTLKNDTTVTTHTQQVEIVEAEDAPEVEEPEPPEYEPPDVMEPVDTDFDGPTDFSSDVVTQTDFTPNEPVSPKPAEFNSVSIVKSPIVMRNILGSRSPGQRGTALAKFGGSKEGEATVMRALRWLKSKQKPDGSWDGQATANTGLAILTFLAHGETPSPDNPEFGPTVEKAIKFLCDEQRQDGLFQSKDGHNYSHLIATYALSEAYSMTKNPLVKEAAEKAVAHIIRGQYPSGTWAYNMKFDEGYPTGDTSYAGWAAQAIKAAHTAGLEAEGLHEAYEKAAEGFLLNHNESRGGFGYNNKNPTGLSGVGALCMQLLGKWNHPAVKRTMDLLADYKFSFENWKQPIGGGSPIYYWYYITQAKFQEGGATFKQWNQQFMPELIKQQVKIPKEDTEYNKYVDQDGNPRDIGFWDSPSKGEHHTGGGKHYSANDKYARTVYPGNGEAGVKDETTDGGRIQDTCLCALQLMVYYRFLPATLAVNAENQPTETKPKSSKEVTVKAVRRRASSN